MTSHSALTEEGRTRIRNFQGRVNSYLVLWFVIALVAVVGGIYLKTRYGFRPLQRLYLSQYVKASIKSFIPSKRPSKYILLVRVVDDQTSGQERVLGCTDDQVTVVRDDTGHVRFDPKLGPFFQLKQGIAHKYFYWNTVWQKDTEMYQWLSEQIYGGHSLAGLYWLCFLPLPFIVITGMIVSVKVDLYTNREYEEGRLMRGMRLLRRSEYARESKEMSGLGLPVFEPEKRLR